TMLLGATVGIVLNAGWGEFRTVERIEIAPGDIDQYGMAAPINVEGGLLWVVDTPNHVLIEVSVAANGRYETRRAVVRVPSDEPVAWPDPPPQVDPDRKIPVLEVPTLNDLGRKDPVAFALFRQFGKSPARTVGDASQTLGDLFLRLLRMVSVPLIITSLITG